MRINSPASLKVAAETFRRFNGDWIAAYEAGTLDEDGVLVIRASTLTEHKSMGHKSVAPAS